MRGTKVLATAGTLLLVSAVGILHQVPPASGYEISIYRAYPWYFWTAIGGALLSGQLVLLWSAFYGHDDDRDWVFGVGLMVVSDLVLFLLPYLRGYPIYGRADVLTHVGIARDVYDIGITRNIYSPMHVLLQATASATGLDPMTLIYGLSIVFSILFIGSMYFLIDHLFERRATVLVALSLVFLPIMGHTHVIPTPWELSILLTPFVLFLLLKAQRTQATAVRALLLLSIVGIVVFHPLMAAFIAIAFGLHLAIVRRVRFKPYKRTSNYVASITFALAIVVFGAWYTKFAGIIVRFRIVGQNLLAGSEETELEARTETIERTSPELVDLFEPIVFRYGTTALLFGLATLFLAYVTYRWWRNGERPSPFVLLFGCCVPVFAVLGALFLTNNLIAGFDRPVNAGKVFALVLSGPIWYIGWRAIDGSARQIALAVVLCLTMLTIVYLSVFGLFFSPNTASVNQQVTEMELDGMEWTFENRNDEQLVEEFGLYQYRFYHLEHGYNLQNGSSQAPPTIRRTETRPPDHFNYTERRTLGQSYEDDRYLVLTRLGRIRYPNTYPDYKRYWRYTPEDFERVEEDPTVMRIYDNGEFDLYKIHATAADTAAGPRNATRRNENRS